MPACLHRNIKIGKNGLKPYKVMQIPSLISK